LDVTVIVFFVGIGDRRRVVDADDPFGSSSYDTTSTTEELFDRQFLQISEGFKFEGDICVDLSNSEASTLAELEEIALAKEEKGSSLTASEVQALGDMTLQSAVSEGRKEGLFSCPL
jgi:hypothetical protein